MKEQRSWPVVIGQKGSIVLPREMVDFAGAYTDYALSVTHEFLGGRRGRQMRVWIEMSPRFVATTEGTAVTSRRRLYIGRALSVLGFDEALLRQTPRELRRVQLALTTGAPALRDVAYRLDVSAMVSWKRKGDHLKNDTAKLEQDLNQAAEQGIRAGGFLRRFFLMSKRYLLAEEPISLPAHRAPRDLQPLRSNDYLRGRKR